MPRGNFCPNCGEQTFHADGGSMNCSSCGAVGWLGGAKPGPGSGRGHKCRAKGCGKQTLRTVAQMGDTELKYCSNCHAMVIV